MAGVSTAGFHFSMETNATWLVSLDRLKILLQSTYGPCTNSADTVKALSSLKQETKRFGTSPGAFASSIHRPLSVQ